MQTAQLAVERFSNVVIPTRRDIPAILRLLSESPDRCAPMQEVEVLKFLHTFRVIRDHSTDEVIASLSLQRINMNTQELRGVTVARSARGFGLAGQLMTAVLAEASKTSSRIVCATKIPTFFERFGFIETEEIDLPIKPRAVLACSRKRVVMVLARSLRKPKSKEMRKLA